MMGMSSGALPMPVHVFCCPSRGCDEGQKEKKKKRKGERWYTYSSTAETSIGCGRNSITYCLTGLLQDLSGAKRCFTRACACVMLPKEGPQKRIWLLSVSDETHFFCLSFMWKEQCH